MYGFKFLDTFRGYNAWNGTPEPFSLELLISYCNLHEIEGDQLSDFLHLVSTMDMKYRAWIASKKTAATENKPPIPVQRPGSE
jgi:hypothetical protein